MASSSSSSQEEYKYEVFLSFRGEDTRRGFTAHLYDALNEKNIRTFMDDRKTETGYKISQLKKAIMGSKIWIIVFSKDFASSTWCLDEVVQILECNRKRNGEIKGNVIPIFYGIKPTIVRKQEESYGAAFAKHAERFKHRIEMVQLWKDTLNEVSGVTGHDSENFRCDPELIDKIVNDVLLKLPKNQLTIDHFEKNLIGIEEPFKDIESILCIDSKEDVRIIGIWGMGGIGKTTLASTVFDIYKSSFDANCILKNIREESERYGKEHLRKKLLFSLLDDESLLKKDTSSVISTFIERKFGQKKVIVVLDDVDEPSSLKYFLEGHDQFAAGSRIIVTTRDVQLLRPVTDKIYKVKGLCYGKALELFHKHAFGGQISLAADYEALSEKAVNYADGNPLALMVLGSSLHSKSKKQWESALDKQKIDTHKGILQVLKISYDRLSKGTQKMFLDIACFAIGEVERKSVENMFNCGDDYDAAIEITTLIDKSLIRETLSCTGTVWLSMHDLLREMGWAIVCDESEILGNRSRLWNAKDVCHVLGKNKGTETIQGISLNLFNIDIKKKVQVSPTVFSNMCRLRYLRIYGEGKIDDCDFFQLDEIRDMPMDRWQFGCIYQQMPFKYKYIIYAHEGLFDISDELRYFHWDSYSCKYLPNFNPENLVGLIMRESGLEKLWNEVEVLDLVKLKEIDLSYSEHLTEIKNLSGAINLEIIYLHGCKSLVQVHLNFQNHPKLKFLDLGYCDNLEECKDSENLATNTALIEEVPLSSVPVQLDFSNCKRLRSIPDSTGKLKNLKWLDLTRCPDLEKFPEICSDGMEYLRDLSLQGTGIEELPESMGNIKNLEELSLRDCKRLKSLPKSIGKLKYLKNLIVSDCPNLEQFPEISSDGMECLHDLSLQRTWIEELPESIGNIKNLEELSLRGCKRLKSIPKSIGKLKYLKKLIVSDCPNLQGKYFPEILDVMNCLYEIDLGGTGIEELPESIENLTGLRILNLGGCRQIKFLPDNLCKLSSLYKLNLKECSSLEQLPRLPLGLKQLNIEYCDRLKSIQQLPPLLAYLAANGCTSLKTISSCELTHNRQDLGHPMVWRFENSLDLDHYIIADTVYNRIHAYPYLEIVYPGNEIPKLFNNVIDDGNSISIRHPPNWFRLDGRALFVVCIVGVLNNFDDDDDFDDHDERRRTVSLEYEFKFKTSDYCAYKCGRVHEISIANTNNADHVFIVYQRDYMCLDVQELKKVFGCGPERYSICSNDTLQASFSVFFKQGEGVNLDIKKYGIHFLYGNDEPNADSTSGECSNQASGNQDTDRATSSDYFQENQAYGTIYISSN